MKALFSTSDRFGLVRLIHCRLRLVWSLEWGSLLVIQPGYANDPTQDFFSLRLASDGILALRIPSTLRLIGLEKILSTQPVE
jgi:hypothetical protein